MSVSTAASAAVLVFGRRWLHDAQVADEIGKRTTDLVTPAAITLGAAQQPEWRLLHRKLLLPPAHHF
jgi:hypothetical protein